eukprot:7801778-Alexandrium_andersonii.AAC.1
MLSGTCIACGGHVHRRQWGWQMVRWAGQREYHLGIQGHANVALRVHSLHVVAAEHGNSLTL